MKEYSSAGKYEHVLRPNLQRSMPISEEIYQVIQPILRPTGPLSTPEVYDALLDTEPASLSSFLGISFEASVKNVEPESVTRLKNAYDGENLIVQFKPDHILFQVGELKNEKHSLKFVASANVSGAITDRKGRIAGIELQKNYPYFLFYLLRTNSLPSEFKSYVKNQFQFATAEPVEMGNPMQLGYDITTQLFTIIRGYQSPLTAALYQRT